MYPDGLHSAFNTLVDTGDICCHYWQHILVNDIEMMWQQGNWLRIHPMISYDKIVWHDNDNSYDNVKDNDNTYDNLVKYLNSRLLDV